MEPVKLLERAAGTAVHVVRHPIASVAYAVGLARGLAEAAVHGVTVTGHDPQAGEVPQQHASRSGPPRPQRVLKPVPEPRAAQEPVVIEPEPAGESFATEPTVASRDTGHGHPPDAPDADLQQPGTEPLLDPGTAKAIRSESAMMRKGAERDPE